MQVDDPPYLPVGTAVSAKYKGAFCEAKVSKVVRVVKCKVSFKNGLGTSTLTDDSIKGTLRVGQLVQAKHPDKKEFVDATITKIQDCSQYTVVFDDGDITTLRRTALCLKSGRHFNESETLDQLPLTHPEHFGNPVVGGRRGRRSRQLKEDSSEGEAEEENEPDMEQYSTETGKVVCVETSDKKRSKDNWFPGLVVMPSAQPTVRINVKDEYLVRSFKDGRYYTVPKKEVSDFSRDMATRVESNVLAEAVEKVIKYLDQDELPVHWEKNTLFNMQPQYSDSEENFTDSSDDEPREEKDHFVAQLYKFMDDAGTPLNKTPMVNNKDVDLYRLFRVVQKLGGYNRVTNQNKWRSVTTRLKFSNNQNTCNQVKMVYKKCLFSYEAFYRTLGCTMLSHPRTAKKSRDRTLIRGKDRSTPTQSPRPEKDVSEAEVNEKKDKEKDKDKDKDKEDEEKEKEREKEKEKEKPKPVKKEVKPKVEVEKKKKEETTSDTNSSGETTDQSETPSTSYAKEKEKEKEKEKIKKPEVKTPAKEKKVKPPVVEKSKTPVETKTEDVVKKEEKEDKTQQTRAKGGQQPKASKEAPSPDRRARETKTPMRENPNKTSATKSAKKSSDEDKKRGRKRNIDEKSSGESGFSESSSGAPSGTVWANIGDRLKVFYGPTHESKVTYEAKVIDIDRDNSVMYLVHYTGWNNRYDEWIAPSRIAENLSAATKAKRLKQGTQSASTSSSSSSSATATSKAASQSKPPVKRSRGISVTGRNSVSEIPRSTTPSSVTSSSSRTKSPATPATRNSSRLNRQGDSGRKTRRMSVQTDNSIHSDSDSDSESETEILKARSIKEEVESKGVRKRLIKPKKKDDDDTEKEDEIETKTKRTKKVKKIDILPTEDDSDEEICNPPPKGRDFDLNQIRSELKGFSKAVKGPNPSDPNNEKDSAVSSDDSTTVSEEKIKEEVLEIEEVETPMEIEKSVSSDDIYEFKEPEPFEFESRKSSEEKNKKRLVPRVLDDTDKSPKKKTINKTPIKIEPVKEAISSSSSSTQPVVEEKKWFKRTPIKKVEEPEIEIEKDEKIDEPVIVKKSEDPFDKLVESPSFQIVNKTSDKIDKEKEKVVKNLNLKDEEDSLMKDEVNTNTEDDERGDTSDNEEFTSESVFPGKEELFSDSNTGPGSPEETTNEQSKDALMMKDEKKTKDSDDDDPIRVSIKRIVRPSISDEESNDDLLMAQTPTCFSKDKQPTFPIVVTPLQIAESQVEVKVELAEPSDIPVIQIKEKPVVSTAPKQISPVFQETDSSLLEAMVATPQIIPKVEDFKDIAIKTGPKIADSLLQKLSMIKKPDETIEETKKPDELLINNKAINVNEKLAAESNVALNNKKIVDDEEDKKIKHLDKTAETLIQSTKNVSGVSAIAAVVASSAEKNSVIEAPIQDYKKRSPRNKVVSREFIDESDSDTSDSEERLIIARSDEDDTQNSFSLDNKPDVKESDSNNSLFKSITDDSQTEEERSFKFDKKEDDAEFPVVVQQQQQQLNQQENVGGSLSSSDVKQQEQLPKEEEPDSHLHSMLYCEETIPGSPAPPPTINEEVKEKPKVKSAHEMPFASAPCSSSNSNHKSLININNEAMHIAEEKEDDDTQPEPMEIVEEAHGEIKVNVNVNVNINNRGVDNSPPTTPESTLSNLSPRGNNGDQSPNNADNDSCKSTEMEAEYRQQPTKVQPYSEEDTLMNSESNAKSKSRDESLSQPSPCKKRRRSHKGSTSEDVVTPMKRGRKPNRSRHNSDSDDTSEHSAQGHMPLSNSNLDNRYARSPRDRKYNFYIDFGNDENSNYDRNQRIAIIMQKIQEVRKCYQEERIELATIEKRRKKIKRRKKESKWLTG